MDGLPVGATMDETFFAAQRRHRRTARLYTVLAAFAAVLQGIPLALILSPVVIGAAVLVADVVNLFHPVPDVTPAIGRFLEALAGEAGEATGATEPATEPAPAPAPADADDDAPATISLTQVLLVSVPGLAAMLGLWWLVRRFLLRDGLGGVLITAGARPADRTDAEEHQLVNVVEEISIAAGIRPPRVLVLPAAVPNAAAFGRSPDNWTIAVSRGLLDDLDRDATQGVIAHLVGSVGNGDLRMQHSLLALFVSQQLAQDIITAPFAGSARGRVRGAWRMMRGKAGPEDEAGIIRDLLGWDESDNFVVAINFITFKIVQFYTNLFVVGGILALPFRIRRYLADATAVELARTPDGLGRALVHLHEHRRNLPGAEFAAIYAVTAADVVPGDGSVEDVVTLPASLHPPLRKRVKRLRRLGFRGDLSPERPTPRGRGADWPWLVKALLSIPLFALLFAVAGPLVVLLALTVCVGIVLSVGLGFAFWAAVTLVVVGPLHAILRSLA